MFMLLAKNVKYLCCKRPQVKDIAFLRSLADFVNYCVHDEGYLLPADKPINYFSKLLGSSNHEEDTYRTVLL